MIQNTILILMAIAILAIVVAMIFKPNLIFGDELLHNHTNAELTYKIFYEGNDGFASGTLSPKESKKVSLKNFRGVNFYLNNAIFASYIFIKGSDPVRQLHIGKTIAKHQHESSASLPIKDMPSVRIHNLTNVDLKFSLENSEDFVVVRNGIAIYEGIDKEGITTNEVLKNTENIFGDFKIKRKATDIYYGVISPNDIPTFTERHLF